MHPLLTTTLNRALTLADETTKKAKNTGPNGGKNPKGNGTADKADQADKATGTGSSTSSGDDGGLLGSLTDLIFSHWWLPPVLFLAACIGINYLWKQYRNKQSMRGVAVRPLGPIFRDITKFARAEDTGPLHPKLPPKITANRFYGLLTLLIILSFVPKVPNLPFGPLLPAMVLLLTLGSRYSKVARARRSVLNQMFAVAVSECRYPKGSELAPWNYVQISGWSNFTVPGQTVIQIPAAYQSEDMKTREKFERNFNGTVSEENAWTYKWESAKNRVVCEPAALLPNMAEYPGPGEKWDEIPVGVKGDGSQAIIPLSVTPHTLVCGPTGSGKSVLQRSVLFHILAHSDTWRLVAIDMKRVEMAWLRKYPQVLKVATDLEEAVEVLRSLKAEMMRRYEEMEEAGVNHAKDLPNPPKAIFCMIDESTVLLAPEGIKTDEGKERDALHAEAGMIIGELGRLSRASMIHVMACFQRPDATFLKGETKANFDARIAAGRMDTTPSLMVLDSEAANRLPKIKGRGMIRIGGELDTFHGYFAEQSWFDEWVAKQQGGSPDGGADGGPDGGPDAGPDGGFDDEFDGDDPDGPVPGDAPMPPAPPSAPAEDEGKPKRGLRGLAAKAAAKAQERAARLDAEAGLDVSTDGWVDEGAVVAPAVAGPSGHAAPSLPHAPMPSVPAAPVAVPPVVPMVQPSVPMAPPAVQAPVRPTVPPAAPPVVQGVPQVSFPAPPPMQPVLPVMSDATEDGLGDGSGGLAMEGFDFDSLLVDVDDFDEYDDEGEDVVEEEPVPAPTRPPAPAPVQAPTAPAVQVFQPGFALPSTTPPAAPQERPTAPTQAPAPPPAGLPVRPPAGLPVRPPQPPAAH
jgi:hypothetical protein